MPRHCRRCTVTCRPSRAGRRWPPSVRSRCSPRNLSCCTKVWWIDVSPRAPSCSACSVAAMPTWPRCLNSSRRAARPRRRWRCWQRCVSIATAHLPLRQRTSLPTRCRRPATRSCWRFSSKRASILSKAPGPPCCAGRPNRVMRSRWRTCCATCIPSRVVRAWSRSRRSAIWPTNWSFSMNCWLPGNCSPVRRCSACCRTAMTAWRTCSTRCACNSRCTRRQR
ncbi:hypothetical protein D3C80_1027210 [compost metagenome]